MNLSTCLREYHIHPLVTVTVQVTYVQITIVYEKFGLIIYDYLIWKCHQFSFEIMTLPTTSIKTNNSLHYICLKSENGILFYIQ